VVLKIVNQGDSNVLQDKILNGFFSPLCLGEGCGVNVLRRGEGTGGGCYHLLTGAGFGTVIVFIK